MAPWKRCDLQLKKPGKTIAPDTELDQTLPQVAVKEL
jgi:hypothetical protein